MSTYGWLLARVNRHLEGEFASFRQLPGMGFSDREEWWNGRGKRPRAHEGVDLCWYLDRDGHCCQFGENTIVPFMHDGETVAICDDFHACSVFVRQRRTGLYQDVAVYSHIVPAVAVGVPVKRGETAGKIAPSPGRVPPHLHLSFLRLPHDFALENLNWQFLNQCGEDIFRDPFSVK